MAKEKAKNNYWYLKNHDIEASDHLLARLLSRDYSAEELVEFLKKPAKYKEWDENRQRWKLIRWYEKTAIVTDESFGDVITILRKDKAKDNWVKI